MDAEGTQLDVKGTEYRAREDASVESAAEYGES